MWPSSPSSKPDAAERSLLRVLGGVLASLSLLLALLGIIFHQRVADLMLALIVGMFALRVLLLWLGNKPQRQQALPEWSSMKWERYPLQAPPSPPGQPALSASPSFQSQPLSQLAVEPYPQPSMPLPPAAVAPPLPALPRFIRPQRPPEAPAFPAQPAPPSQRAHPLPLTQLPSLWLPPPSASVHTPSPPPPLLRPSQQGSWQYDDGKNLTQQGGNDHGPA